MPRNEFLQIYGLVLIMAFYLMLNTICISEKAWSLVIMTNAFASAFFIPLVHSLWFPSEEEEKQQNINTLMYQLRNVKEIIDDLLSQESHQNDIV